MPVPRRRRSHAPFRRAVVAAGTAGLLLSAAQPAWAQFTPLTLTPGSFNQDVVVEKTATTPVVPGGYTTASMDGGTANNGDTWNEMGFFTDRPDIGLPVAGTVFTSASDPTHSYRLAPDYTANNAVMLDASATFTSATLIVSSPAAYGALSLLTSGGNGGCIIRYTVHHQDGTTETGTTPSADWFNGANPALITNGRVNAQSFSLDNADSNNPRLYGKDVTLSNSSSPVTSIDLAYVSSAAGAHTCVMAVSGAPAPGGNFSPIGVTGYNADIVVEASAPKAQPLLGFTTATMDGGDANTGATWYELGYAAKAPGTGLPAAGTVLTSVSDAGHKYQLPASYTGNNAIVLDAIRLPVTVTFAPTGPFASLSFLGAAANGDVTVSVEVNRQDGSTQTHSVVVKDWFNNTPFAFTPMGRVNVDNSVLDSVNTQNPRLYSADVPLSNSASPIANLNLTFLSGADDARVVIFAISGGASAVPPVFNTQPATVKLSPGGDATLTVEVGGTPPVSLRWQRNNNGTFEDLQDTGNVSGSGTQTLTITGATESEDGQYRVVATNAGGSTTSAVARLILLSPLANVTAPGDAVTGFGGNFPDGESPPHAIDEVLAKYLNFGGNGGSPFKGPAGFTVTPSSGRTIVTALRFYAANDSEGRDPTDYVLEGSNDGGGTWTAISAGAVALPAARNTDGSAALDPVSQSVDQVKFTNTKGYASYRVGFNHVKDDAGSVFQIGEVELLGVADNSGTPFFTTQPQSVAVVEGGNAQLTAAASGTPVPTLKWYRTANGVTTPVTDGGRVSGSTTGTLSINNVNFGDAGNLLAVASNAAGSTTSSIVSLTVISSRTDVTSPSDVVTAVGDESGTFWGTAADPLNAIDDSTTKYVNGGSGFSSSAGFPPFGGPVGLTVTPAAGSTVVTGIRVYTADGNTERDPVDYKLEGSNNGTSFTTISSGPLALPTRRNAAALGLDVTALALQEVLFSNGAAYTTYRLTFSNVANPTTANSLQVAEIELLGAVGTSGPSLSVKLESNGTVTITSSQPGTLQTTPALLNNNTGWADQGPINGSVNVPASGDARFFRVVQ